MYGIAIQSILVILEEKNVAHNEFAKIDKIKDDFHKNWEDFFNIVLF